MGFEPPRWDPALTVRDTVRLAHVEARPPSAMSPPLVLIHGWAGDRCIFTPQIAHFSKTRRVVAIDLRGHGASDAPEQGYTMSGLAEDVAWQCVQLGLERPVFVGHSLGGVVALELCGRRPDFASGLVMIDAIVMSPPTLFGHPDVLRVLDGSGGPDYRAVLQANARVLAGQYDTAARRRAIFDAYILGPCRTTPQHVAYAALRDMTFHDQAPAAKACRIPMAYISADVPVIDEARDLDRLKKLCPQLVTAKTLLAGHFNTVEVADQVNAMIESFLDVGLRSAEGPAHA